MSGRKEPLPVRQIRTAKKKDLKMSDALAGYKNVQLTWQNFPTFSGQVQARRQLQASPASFRRTAEDFIQQLECKSCVSFWLRKERSRCQIPCCMVVIQVPVFTNWMNLVCCLMDGWSHGWQRLDGLHGQRTVGHGQLRGDLLPV